MELVRLGQIVEDSISGLKGVAIRRIDCLHGSTQIEVQPPLDGDGKYQKPTWCEQEALAECCEAEVPPEEE